MRILIDECMDERFRNAELSGRLRALDELVAGKLIPPLPAQGQGS